jgi:hypothetical protein
MSIRHRIAQLADQVKSAGLKGQSMTAELAKVASEHDLTTSEIERIAESANREVQLGLYKSSQDKRFKFDLARPSEVQGAARKTASTLVLDAAGEAEKFAELTDEMGGDPYAAPSRDSELDRMSLVQILSDEQISKLAEENQEREDREMIMELGKQHSEFEAVRLEGTVWEVKCAQEASRSHAEMAQAACDMIHGGVTLPSLYEAIVAATSGSTCTEEELKAADTITLMVIDELKKRGVENYKMGFRDHGDPDALKALTPEKLLKRCKQVCGYTSDPRNAGTIDMNDVKTAEVYTESTPHATSPKFNDKKQENLLEDAVSLLNSRPSNADHKVPQHYLDDADNYMDGKPRVINATNEFVIAVKNLVGEQGRIHQVHAAQEYVGLKLKEIEEALRKLTNVREAEADRKANVNHEPAHDAQPQGNG